MLNITLSSASWTLKLEDSRLRDWNFRLILNQIWGQSVEIRRFSITRLKRRSLLRCHMLGRKLVEIRRFSITRLKRKICLPCFLQPPPLKLEDSRLRDWNWRVDSTTDRCDCGVEIRRFSITRLKQEFAIARARNRDMLKLEDSRLRDWNINGCTDPPQRGSYVEIRRFSITRLKQTILLLVTMISIS